MILGIDEQTSVKPSQGIVHRWLWVAGSIGLLSMLGVAVGGYLATNDRAEMGQWGDFFGGMLNPFMSFFAFMGLLFTIFLQRQELALSRDELALTRIELKRSSDALELQNENLRKQGFENTFFGMVTFLNQLIDGMDLEEGDDKYTGRDCFSQMAKRLHTNYRHISNTINDNGYYALVYWKDDGVKIPFETEGDKAAAAYKNLYNKYSKDIGHYFRLLYNIFKFVESSGYSGGVYQKILRAQLSEQELLIIFYNCNFEHGKKFRRLAEKFQLFDNLDQSKLLDPDHVSFVAKRAFGTKK